MRLTAPIQRAESPIARAAYATLLASFISVSGSLVADLPASLSPSSPPLTFRSLVIGWPISFVTQALLFCAWLLPACLVVRWIMNSRNVRGLKAASLVGVALALAAAATPYFFAVLFDWPPTEAAVLRRLPLEVESVLFVMTWFIVFELRSRRHAIQKLQGPQAQAPSSRMFLTAIQTLAIAIVAGVVATLGGIAGGIVDFNGDPSYRVESSAESPGGHAMAYLVSRHEGGAVGDLDEQVYLLNSAESWSEANRGLLVWESENLDVVGVTWESERGMRVEVDSRSLRRQARSPSEYSRRGFSVRTVGVQRPQ